MSAELFRKVRMVCTSPYRCQKLVITLAYMKKPICRGCRHRLANLKKQRYHAALLRVTSTRRGSDARS